MLLGNGITKKRTYDALGYLDALNDGNALTMSYSYNKKQGVLNSRTRTGIGQESFQHDQRNRLTRIQKGTEVLEQKYDDYGRLADNPKRGEYHYNAAKRYAMDSLTLNASGLKYYKEHPRQDALYNLDRKAVSIHEHGFGRADFAYNAQMQRTHAWYGGEEENLHSRTYQKHYSSLFPAEITHNNETGKTDIVLYIGGDGYTAPAAKINNEVHYLHRDYLGSILAITNSAGTVVEERQFGAWGEVDFIKIHGQEADFSQSMLPRGFTGHEHFSEIALIHMNGRMYDPQLRRFLSPDNYVSDPYDTRSYDRFGYVWQNPLMSIDPSGEEPVTVAVLTFVAKVLAVHQFVRTVSGYATGYYTGFGPLVNAGIQIASAFIPGASLGSGLIQALPQAATGAGAFIRTVGAAAVQGFVSSSVGSVISGASLNDALKAGLQGAGIAVITAAGFYAVSSIGAKIQANKTNTALMDGRSRLNQRKQLEAMAAQAQVPGITADQLATNANAAWGNSSLALGELIPRLSGSVNYGDYLISSDKLRQNLYTFSNSIGETINIESGNRSLSRNLAVGGANGSRHTFGDAADISVKGMTNLDLAIKSNDSGLFNTTIYYPDVNLPGALRPHVHVDLRPGSSRFLIYSPKMINGKIKHQYKKFR